MEAPGRSQINLEKMFVKFATEVFFVLFEPCVCHIFYDDWNLFRDIIYICVFVAVVFILFTVITYMANVFVCLFMRITWPAGYNPNRSNGRCRTQPGPGQTEV